MDIDPRLKATAQAVIQKLMDDVRGLKAVVISTEDGFEIAARVENTAQISRLAAMASSLAALGAIAGEESQLGNCDNIMIGAAHGSLIMMQAKHSTMNLIISMVAGKEAVIGQVLYASRRASQQLQIA